MPGDPTPARRTGIHWFFCGEIVSPYLTEHLFVCDGTEHNTVCICADKFCSNPVVKWGQLFSEHKEGD